MSVEIITNSVWGAAARILATNALDSAFADQDGIENLTGGPRHLYYTGAGSSDLRAVYVNKGGGLAADRCVIVRADRHEGHGLGIYAWPTYPGSPTVLFGTTAFAEDLVGPRGQDFVCAFDEETNQQAFGIELNDGSGGAYTEKVVQQVFFGTAFNLGYVAQFSRDLLDKFERIVLKRKSYMVREQLRFTATNLTRQDVSDLHALYKLRDEPFFLYDSEGIQIWDKLLYGFIDVSPVITVADDLHSIDMTFFVLEYWV